MTIAMNDGIFAINQEHGGKPFNVGKDGAQQSVQVNRLTRTRGTTNKSAGRHVGERHMHWHVSVSVDAEKERITVQHGAVEWDCCRQRSSPEQFKRGRRCFADDPVATEPG